MISRVIKRMLRESYVEPNSEPEILRTVTSHLPSIPVTRHPLGFVHYDLRGLVDLPEGGFARLHVWDATLAPPDPAGNVHDHTWSLTSAVLLGSLRDKTFKPVSNPRGEFAAVSVKYGDTNSFEQADRYDLTKLTDRVFTRGDTYRISSRIVHESEPLGHPTVTLVVGIPDEAAEASGPLILSRGQAVPHATAQRDKVAMAEAARILDDVLLCY